MKLYDSKEWCYKRYVVEKKKDCGHGYGSQVLTYDYTKIPRKIWIY